MSLRPALLVIPLLAATAAFAQSPAAPPDVEPPPQPAAAGTAVPPSSTPAVAASGAPAEGARSLRRIGVGVALGTSGVLPAVYVPFDTEGVRTELELGYDGSPTADDEDSALRVGLGVFGLASSDGPVRGYGGVRLRYARAELGGATSAAVRLAAAFGGEWVPTPAVAIGAEGQLGFTRFSEPDHAPNRLDVTAQAFLRVFTSVDGRRGARPAPAAAKAPAAPAAPSRLARCRTSADCDRGICYEGYCRR